MLTIKSEKKEKELMECIDRIFEILKDLNEVDRYIISKSVYEGILEERLRRNTRRPERKRGILITIKEGDEHDKLP